MTDLFFCGECRKPLERKFEMEGLYQVIQGGTGLVCRETRSKKKLVLQVRPEAERSALPWVLVTEAD